MKTVKKIEMFFIFNNGNEWTLQMSKWLICNRKQCCKKLNETKCDMKSNTIDSYAIWNKYDMKSNVIENSAIWIQMQCEATCNMKLNANQCNETIPYKLSCCTLMMPFIRIPKL